MNTHTHICTYIYTRTLTLALTHLQIRTQVKAQRLFEVKTMLHSFKPIALALFIPLLYLLDYSLYISLQVLLTLIVSTLFLTLFAVLLCTIFLCAQVLTIRIPPSRFSWLISLKIGPLSIMFCQIASFNRSKHAKFQYMKRRIEFSILASANIGHEPVCSQGSEQQLLSGRARFVASSSSGRLVSKQMSLDANSMGATFALKGRRQRSLIRSFLETNEHESFWFLLQYPSIIGIINMVNILQVVIIFACSLMIWELQFKVGDKLCFRCLFLRIY